MAPMLTESLPNWHKGMPELDAGPIRHSWGGFDLGSWGGGSGTRWGGGGSGGRGGRETERKMFDPTPVSIFYHWRTTTVHWKDGTITTVTAMRSDVFTREGGFTAALAKRLYGTKKTLKQIVNAGKVVPVTIAQYNDIVKEDLASLEREDKAAEKKAAKFARQAEARVIAKEKKMIEDEAKAARDEKKAEDRRQKRILRDAERVVAQREYNEEVLAKAKELEQMLDVDERESSD